MSSREPPDLPTAPPGGQPAAETSAAAGKQAAGGAPGAAGDGGRNRASDESLIARSKQGDFEAFEELVTRYEDKVYRLAYRFVRNETEAKEIVQDTLLSVWRKLDGFKGDSQFGSWLFRVTANAALMRLRSQRRHAEISTEELPPGFLDTQPAVYGQMLSHGVNWSKRPDEELQSDELRRKIQSAVDALPEIYRTVFLVRDVDGLSTEETAEALGLSVPTVKTRLHRARISLRDAIGSYFDETRGRGGDRMASE